MSIESVKCIVLSVFAVNNLLKELDISVPVPTKISHNDRVRPMFNSLLWYTVRSSRRSVICVINEVMPNTVADIYRLIKFNRIPLIISLYLLLYYNNKSCIILRCYDKKDFIC